MRRAIVGFLVALVAAGECEEQLSAANQQAADAKGLVTGLQSELAQTKEKFEAAEKELSGATQEMAKLRHELSGAATRVGQVEAAAHKSEVEVERLRTVVGRLEAENESVKEQLNQDSQSANVALEEAKVALESLTTNNAELANRVVAAESALKTANGNVEIELLKAAAECEAAKSEEAEAVRQGAAAEMKQQQATLEAQHAKAIVAVQENVKTMESKLKSAELNNQNLAKDLQTHQKQLEEAKKKSERLASDLALAKSKEAEPFVFSMSQASKLLSGYRRLLVATHSAISERFVPPTVTESMRKILFTKSAEAATFAWDISTEARVFAGDLRRLVASHVDGIAAPVKKSPVVMSVWRTIGEKTRPVLDAGAKAASQGLATSRKLATQLAAQTSQLAVTAGNGLLDVRAMIGKVDPTVLSLLPSTVPDLAVVLVVLAMLTVTGVRILGLVRWLVGIVVFRLALPLLFLATKIVVVFPCRALWAFVTCPCRVCRGGKKGKAKGKATHRSPVMTTPPPKAPKTINSTKPAGKKL